MSKRYIVELANEERTQLLELVKKGKSSAREIARAHILLSADRGDSDKSIAEALHVSVPTVFRTRRRFVQERLAALKERPRPGAKARLGRYQEVFDSSGDTPAPARGVIPSGLPHELSETYLDGKGEAFLVALACSEAPGGRERWTVRLLADRMVELEVVESISRETVRRVLKRERPSRG